MSMNYKEVSRGLPQEEIDRYSQGIALMGSLADSLRKQGLLPKRFSKLTEPTPQAIPQEGLTVDLIQQAIAEYKRGVTPEAVTKFWGAMLPDLPIPECDWSVEAIKRPMKDIKGNDIPGILVPDVDDITLPLLGRKYPEMASGAVRDETLVTDIHNTRGYIKVYASVDAPNRDTTQWQLEEFAQKEGYLGGRLRTYILASQASKVLTGKYMNQGNTWSRLLGSLDEGFVIRARFRADGGLYVGWDLIPEDRDSGLGGRFEEVNKT